MSGEIDYTSIKETVKFLNNIITIKRTLRKCNGIVDCNSILKLFKFQNETEDSGFESEVSVYNQSCFVPATELEELIFGKSIDELFEENLFHMCKCIQTLSPELKEDQSKIEELLEFVIKFVEFLAEVVSCVPFREIVRTFLESMLNNALADTKEHSLFNFVLEVFRRFAKVKDLQGDICDIMIQRVHTLAKSVKMEELDAFASFHYEMDLSRANSLLFTLFIMKQENNCQYSHQNKEDLYEIFEIFSKLDDFFSFGFLSYKIISQILHE